MRSAGSRRRCWDSPGSARRRCAWPASGTRSSIAGLVGAEGEFPDAFGSDVWVLSLRAASRTRRTLFQHRPATGSTEPPLPTLEERTRAANQFDRRTLIRLALRKLKVKLSGYAE